MSTAKDCREHDDRHVAFDGCRGVRRTEKALLVRFGDGEEVWIPQSQISDDSEVYGEGHEGTLVVTRFIAEQKGLV